MAFNPRPVVDNADGASDALPNNHGQSKFRFYLTLNPHAWKWHDEFGWVPDVGILPITPGASGVATPASKGGVIDPNPAINSIRRHGSKAIEPLSEYLVQAKTKSGKTAYFTKFDVPDVYFDEVTWERDEKAFYEYIMTKVGSTPGNMIPDCPKVIKERKISAQRKRRDRIQAALSASPSNGALKLRLETETARLEAMVASLDESGAGDEGGAKTTKRATRSRAKA